ncbi:LicD family protein [Alisedimentitalea sp. MJ-SS2]|uniref:LicD family protein n=1 Tax=Aliisedimentitalea sp. MJ-SS2 TaxID=3049795 RepID=UPI00290E1EFB|nr:LicD family protein [Alisedimentitalea sp. MJ-SS2]MDU8926547.1 LicD family protein [Alisedimentitalea sp. MJ-SS2]
MNKAPVDGPFAARIEQLRRRALSQIIAPRDGYKARAIVIELGEMADAAKDHTSPEFLEATILAIIARGGRPRRAQKPLYRLFRARLEDGKIEKYQQFQQVLTYSVRDRKELEGLHFHSAFGTMNQAEVWADIEQVMSNLKAVGSEVFLNSGTLLGAVRDKALIAHDDDVDLAIRLDASSTVEAVEQWKKTRELLQNAGFLSERQPTNPGTMKLKASGGYNVDLFPAWVDEGQVYVYPHTCGDLTEDQVFPLKPCETTGLPIPKDPEAMLAVNYGDGWKHPDPGFAFNWAHANRRFAVFKNALDHAEQAA